MYSNNTFHQKLHYQRKEMGDTETQTIYPTTYLCTQQLHSCYVLVYSAALGFLQDTRNVMSKTELLDLFFQSYSAYLTCCQSIQCDVWSGQRLWNYSWPLTFFQTPHSVQWEIMLIVHKCMHKRIYIYTHTHR